MATAWKKVALSSDIPVGVGGTANSGPGDAEHDVLIQGSGGNIESQALAENEVLIGTDGAAPTAKAFGMGDVRIGTGDQHNIELNIESGAVDTTELASGAVTLAKIGLDFISGDPAGGIVYWAAAENTVDSGDDDDDGNDILINGDTHQQPQLLAPVLTVRS